MGVNLRVVYIPSGLTTDRIAASCTSLSAEKATTQKKTDFCICKNKGADQLGGNHKADQHLCFHYTDSTMPLLPEAKISSFLPFS